MFSLLVLLMCLLLDPGVQASTNTDPRGPSPPSAPEGPVAAPPGSFQFHTTQVLRHNYGVVFEKQPRVLLNGHTSFRLYFQVPRPTLPDFPKLPQVSTCPQTSQPSARCQSIAALRGAFMSTYQLMVADIKVTNAAIRALLPHPLTPVAVSRVTK